MNKWSMDGNSIEKWSGGGGRTTCSGCMSHYSIHPQGRDDTYRGMNRANRFKAKLHGRRDSAPEPKGKKGK